MNVQKQPPEAFCKKMCSTKFTGKPVPETFLKKRLRAQACNFIKKETLVQAISCELREISKNNYFTEHI